jgi:hypothetical protein
MARRILVLVAALAIIPATAGAATPKLSTLKLSVEVTTTAVDDWHYLSADKAPADAVWSEGKGSQTVGYHWKGKLDLLVANRALVARGAQPYQLQPLAAQTAPKATVQREVESWTDHTPVLCGGELGDCGGTQPAPDTHPQFHCGTKKADLQQFVVGSSGNLFQGGGVLTPISWGDCPLPNLRYSDPDTFSFKPFAKLARLKKGRHMTLRQDAESGITDTKRYRGECPPLSGVGQQECSRTAIFARVKRIG